jgi:hypothetical protein
MTDEHLSEFHSRANDAIDRRARGLLAAVVIALIAVVTLIMCWPPIPAKPALPCVVAACYRSRARLTPHPAIEPILCCEVERWPEMPVSKVGTLESTNEESRA